MCCREVDHACGCSRCSDTAVAWAFGALFSDSTRPGAASHSASLRLVLSQDFSLVFRCPSDTVLNRFTSRIVAPFTSWVPVNGVKGRWCRELSKILALVEQCFY